VPFMSLRPAVRRRLRDRLEHICSARRSGSHFYRQSPSHPGLRQRRYVVPAGLPRCATTDRSVPTTPIFYCYMHLLLDRLQLSLLVPGGGLGHSQKIVIVDAYGTPPSWRTSRRSTFALAGQVRIVVGRKESRHDSNRLRLQGYPCPAPRADANCCRGRRPARQTAIRGMDCCRSISWWSVRGHYRPTGL
jgi:hypothetical protein